MIKVEQWTQEQQENYKKEHEFAETKEWVVRDGRLVFGFYNSLRKAQVEADNLNLDDKIANDFQEWIDSIQDKYPSADLKHIYEVIEAQHI